MTEAEIAEKWVALAKKERKRVKLRDGGKMPQPQGTAKKSKLYSPPPRAAYNPDMTKSRSYNPERFEKIKSLLAKGHSNREIGRMLGISDTSVRYWKRRYNLVKSCGQPD